MRESKGDPRSQCASGSFPPRWPTRSPLALYNRNRTSARLGQPTCSVALKRNPERKSTCSNGLGKTRIRLRVRNQNSSWGLCSDGNLKENGTYKKHKKNLRCRGRCRSSDCFLRLLTKVMPSWNDADAPLRKVETRPADRHGSRFAREGGVPPPPPHPVSHASSQCHLELCAGLDGSVP